MIKRGSVRLSKSLVDWEIGEARRGRRAVRVRVSFPDSARPARIEGEWGIDAKLAATLIARGLWPECVVEMARDAARAAVRRVA